MSSKEEQAEDDPEIPGGRINYGDYEIPRDLNAFKRDTLFVLASIDDPTGANVQRALEAMYRKPINQGQLYPSLDELHENGLIDKMDRDKKTNEYLLTRRGRHVIDEYRNFVLNAVPEE